MDEFVGFNFLLLDASQGRKATVVERGPRRERVDVIARQFRDSLRQGDPADDSPRTIMLTHDFRLRRRVWETAGWLTFLVDRGAAAGSPEEVAHVVFARSDDAAAGEALRKLEPHIDAADLPEAPLVVAVRLAARVPSVVSEWYGKSVAGFFATRP